MLADTKESALARQAKLQGRVLQDLQAQRRRAAGFVLYNTSRYDFEKLVADAPHLAANLRNYIAGFSQNMREVIERFDFDNTISKLDEAGLLFQVLERFKNVNMHPDRDGQPDDGHHLRGADPLVATEAKDGGSRIAIIMNGSPLFTGDAGSGESEIRRYILESDPLEALIALPLQHFYNTGIATYVWVVSNRQARARRGKVQSYRRNLVLGSDAPKLGRQRREIPIDRARDILKILRDFRDGDARPVGKDDAAGEAIVSRI